MPTKEPTPPPPHTDAIRMSETKIGQDFDRQNAFFGLTQFAALWISFKKSDCEGIDARFEIKEPLTVQFVIRKGNYHCELVYDLPDVFHCTERITVDIKVAIWKMRGQYSPANAQNVSGIPTSPPPPRKTEG